mmetsp:Transcript_22486/g.48901  ORF Transcript_22486/g.48901 Transcript_22486/m.48901 type:complete len:82 (+) Transcript_22486:151-396(+)
MVLLSVWFLLESCASLLRTTENLEGGQRCKTMLSSAKAPLSSLKYRPEENSESRFGIRRVQLVQIAKETSQYEQVGKNSEF